MRVAPNLFAGDDESQKGPIRLEVIDRLVGIETYRDVLEDCLARTQADIYFAPDWLLAWAESWGKGGQLRLLMIWHGTEVAGFLPFLVERLWIGPVPVRIARLAGTDPGHAVMGLPLPFEVGPKAAACLDLIFGGLIDCQAICISPLSQNMPGLDVIRASAERARFSAAADDWPRQYTAMHLSDNFEAWLDSLSKSRRREYRKDLKILSECGPLATRRTTPETAVERLAAFVELHSAQWQAVGKAGHFGDWPDALPFAQAAMTRLAPSGRAWIDEHWCGDRLLSAQYGFRQGNRTYWWLIGRTLAPDLVKLGVGRVGLVERVRGLIAEGVREIEAGAGEYDYKLNYGGELVAMGRVVLAAPGATGRVWLLLQFADLLDLFYYRIWFLKLAPRLRGLMGLHPRPLWHLWRKTRL